jgi:hypothetical protein
METKEKIDTCYDPNTSPYFAEWQPEVSGTFNRYGDISRTRRIAQVIRSKVTSRELRQRAWEIANDIFWDRVASAAQKMMGIEI